MHKNSYAVAPSIIDEEICDEIIRIGELIDDMSAEIDNMDATSTHTRLSTVSWFTQHQAEKYDLEFDMIYSHIYEKFHQVAAEAGWGDWEITKSQSFQYTKYGPGGHYNWHPDTHPDPYSQGDEAGLMRKLSMTLCLSDPEEYEGGNFLIEDINAGSPAEFWHRVKDLSVNPDNVRKGSIIAFPSHMWHVVKPVRVGVRRSLVGWFCGPPWR